MNGYACLHMGVWPDGLACRKCYDDQTQRSLIQQERADEWREQRDLWLDRAEKAGFDMSFGIREGK